MYLALNFKSLAMMPILSISSLEDGKFLVRPSAAGNYTILVTSKVDWRTMNYTVVAKNAPMPTPMLLLNATGLRKGGEIAMNVFKGATAMLAQIENFDFDAKCGIAGFTLTHIPKKGEPVAVENIGPMFNATVVAAIQKCKPGDLYLFSNIKTKLPGDLEARPLSNTIGYFIK
jgi:GldM C-terminal domain